MGIKDSVEHVGTLSHILSEYGPYVVMGSIFILAFIAILILFLKMNTEMLSNVMKQIDNKNQETGVILNRLLDNAIRINNKDEDEEEEKEEEKHISHHKDVVKMFVNYNNIFNQAGISVLHSLKCNRVAIYLFHNGNSSAYGFPFIKMSCIYDVNARGLKTTRQSGHTDIPLHAFSDIIQELYDKGEYYANASENNETDESINQFLANSDSKSVFMKVIKKDEDDAVVGFTVCEFHDEKNFVDHEIYKKIIKDISNMNTSIKYIVTDEDIASKFIDD